MRVLRCSTCRTTCSTPGGIAAYLTDPENYGALNPFVISVGDARERDEAVEFTAVESNGSGCSARSIRRTRFISSCDPRGPPIG